MIAVAKVIGGGLGMDWLGKVISVFAASRGVPGRCEFPVLALAT